MPGTCRLLNTWTIHGKALMQTAQHRLELNWGWGGAHLPLPDAPTSASDLPGSTCTSRAKEISESNPVSCNMWVQEELCLVTCMHAALW